MGYYEPCHHPLPSTTTHHDQPPPKINSPPLLLTKINLPPPTTTQNKPSTNQSKPTITHHHQPPAKIYSPLPTTTHHHPKYTYHHPNIPIITNTNQIKAPKYAKTTPRIDLYYLSSCITIWKINWMLNTDNGIKQFLLSFSFNDIKWMQKKTTEELLVSQ